jgi:hypothetical protein
MSTNEELTLGEASLPSEQQSEPGDDNTIAIIATDVLSEQTQSISTLEKKIMEHHNETNARFDEINGKLSHSVDSINAQASVGYTSVKEEADVKIAELQRQIEFLVQQTLFRQNEIYEDICQKTQEAKAVAYNNMQLLSQKRSKEMLVMTESLKQRKIEAGLPINDSSISFSMDTSSVSSSFSFTNPDVKILKQQRATQNSPDSISGGNGSGSDGGNRSSSKRRSSSSHGSDGAERTDGSGIISHSGETREQLIIRGMAMYQLSRNTPTPTTTSEDATPDTDTPGASDSCEQDSGKEDQTTSSNEVSPLTIKNIKEEHPSCIC